jgi:drug/metabolite transporter (DMT)-like permease
VAEPVEQVDLLVRVTADAVVLRQPRDELADARPELVREVRRRGADEGVDVVARRVALHRAEGYAKATATKARVGNVEPMRGRTVDLMLLGTILLWALNITVTRYVLTHGFRPLAYGTTRYLAAVSLFWGFTYWRERSFRVARRDIRIVAVAALMIFMNQVGFVYAVHLTTASTVALILGTTPMFVGILSTAVGLERMGRTFWLAAAISFLGVAFIAWGSGHVSGSLWGDLFAVGVAATWAGYSVAIAPLMRRYSPFRISALVLAVGWVPLALVSVPQVRDQSFDGFGWKMWLAFGYAVVGPLFLTNILWFTAIDRVGPSRASLFANLQPFFAVVFALLLLSEHLNRYEVAGGFAIAAGIALERVQRRLTQPVPVE